MKEKILELLEQVERPGMDILIEKLCLSDYFTAPASTKWHRSYAGGLSDHSYNVYILFKDMLNKFKVSIPKDSIILISLLHDVCKINAYIFKENKFIWNKEHIKGHAKLSIKLIEKFIDLTELEKDCILYHMSFYGSSEFDTSKAEYFLRELVNAFNNNKIIKLFAFCDDMESQFRESITNKNDKTET